MNVNDDIWVRFKNDPEKWHKYTLQGLMQYWAKSPNLVDNEIRLEEPEECRDPLVRFREHLIAITECDYEAMVHVGHIGRDLLKTFDELLGDKS